LYSAIEPVLRIELDYRAKPAFDGSLSGNQVRLRLGDPCNKSIGPHHYRDEALAIFDLGGNIVQSFVPNSTEFVEFPASRKVEQQSFPVMQMLAQPSAVF